ncbi:MAG: NAD(P)H-binding protein, partial [Balneolales bacterium]
MQTILGSDGPIATELAKALASYTKDIRLVSRNPRKVNPGDELIAADLMNYDELRRAAGKSEVVYVTIGFPYNYKIWKKQWPVFIKNVIRVCTENNSRLVFFDNIYMYDQHHLNGMTESTPINPPSKKGMIRAEIAGHIMEEVKKGRLKALIARSADYYGPSVARNSILMETVFKPLSAGKKANWLGSDQFRHSFT